MLRVWVKTPTGQLPLIPWLHAIRVQLFVNLLCSAVDGASEEEWHGVTCRQGSPLRGLNIAVLLGLHAGFMGCGVRSDRLHSLVGCFGRRPLRCSFHWVLIALSTTRS